ncbi:hypothetical protein BsWGS_08883 [Bradybaena similaris]
MALLTKEETLHFIRDVMEVPIRELPHITDPSLSAKFKVDFLSTILKAHLGRQPFQSITLMSWEVKDRHRPSWEEIKSNMLLRRGGVCYWHNTFMYGLLASLGFDVTMSHSTVAGGFDRDNHLVVLVHDLVSKGSLHVVDVGMGFYIPRPIPLDFDDESAVFKDSILTYKLKKESPNKIIVLQATKKETPSSGDNAQNSAEELEWNNFYEFDPTERFRNLDEFFPCFNIFFSDVTKLPFHTSARAVCFPNGKLIGIVNTKLLEEKEEGKLTKSLILKDLSVDSNNPGTQSGQNGLQPLINAYAKHFPQFPLDVLLPALNNFRGYILQKEGPRHVDYN